MADGDRNPRSGMELRHWTPSSPRLDASAEPLIAPGSVVGLWPLSHWLAVPLHDHDFYEVALVTQGTGYHFAGDREAPIRKGTVIFVPPGVAHGYRALRDLVIYNCFFRAELSDFELLWASRDDALKTLFGRRGSGLGHFVDHVVLQLEPADLEACIAQLDAIRQLAANERSHANELGHLLLALDLIARHGRADRPTARTPRPPAPRAVSAALQLIEADLARHWTLADLSREVYVGTYHLAHEFKRWVGEAPLVYANRRRVEQAAVLLSGTDESVAAIGRSVGWADPSSFSRHFRSAFNVGPREYRRRSNLRIDGPVMLERLAGDRSD